MLIHPDGLMDEEQKIPAFPGLPRLLDLLLAAVIAEQTAGIAHPYENRFYITELDYSNEEVMIYDLTNPS